MTTPGRPANAPESRNGRLSLAHEPDGRSWTARENLADILERELLGPLNGPEEVMTAPPTRCT